MRCQNLNCQKQSLKGQSGIKSPVKPTWSKKMTVLSTFLESSLTFLFNNVKNSTKFAMRVLHRAFDSNKFEELIHEATSKSN